MGKFMARQVPFIRCCFFLFLLSNCGRCSSLFIIAEAGVQTIIQITKDLLKVPNHRLKGREKENYRDNNRLFLQYFDVAGSYFRFLPHSVCNSVDGDVLLGDC